MRIYGCGLLLPGAHDGADDAEVVARAAARERTRIMTLG
jgi:hypothetical protein